MSTTNKNNRRNNRSHPNNNGKNFDPPPKNNSNRRPSVAIIGGGIAGLSCAQELVTNPDNKFDVTVYDTGRLRPGGRCASRQPGDTMKPAEEHNIADEYPLLSQYRYDHAAQLIASPKDGGPVSSNSDFAKQLEQWQSNGILQEFSTGSVFTMSKNGKVLPVKDQTFYYGTNGMGSIPLAMVQQASGSSHFQLDQDTWVSPSSGVRYQKNTGTWKLQAKGKTLGFYDMLVIAHNGKCADRIMSKTPAKDVHSLLRVNFNPTVPEHGGKKMTLNSLYSVTVVLPKQSEWTKKLPEEFLCGMIADHPQVRTITCQTKKYPSSNQEHEVWTILSSATFGKKHKAPQEFLPPDVIDKVTTLLVQAVDGILETSVGGTPKKGDDAPKKPMKQSQVLEKRVQLWGAAVPLNVWKNQEGFLYDPSNSVGVAGDWLVEPSIGGAWTSGFQLAQHLQHQQLKKNGAIAGINGSFERSESVKSAGIAAIPQ